MMTEAANPPRCPGIRQIDRHRSTAIFAGFSGKLGTISCQHKKLSPIRLDSWRVVADTGCNTPVAPLLKLAPCHFNDVHQGRVSLCANTSFCRVFWQSDANITAAPLLRTVGQQTHLGRLLFCPREAFGGQA